MVTPLILLTVALLLLAGSVLLVLRARRADHAKKVKGRLQSFDFIPADAYQIRRTNSVMGFISAWLARAGLQLDPMAALTIVGLGLGASWMMWHVIDPLAGIICVVLVATLSVLVPQVRYRQKVNALVAQIPLFIDQVIRGLVTGRNVEGAIKLAKEDLRSPLKEVIERAHNNVELGADLGEALRDAADFYDVKELHMLALAIHTSRVYGSSPREMLESVVNLIRQREQMQRELRAMTGETRVTAWVLGLLPSLIAAYMVWQNPGYIGPMWTDPSGRNVLLTALGFQALGGLILWRMVKSI